MVSPDFVSINLLTALLLLALLACVVLAAVVLRQRQALRYRGLGFSELRPAEHHRTLTPELPPQNDNHLLLRQLIDHLPQLIAAKDQHGVYIECNQSYLDFLGLSRSQVLGRKTSELFDNETQQSLAAQDEQVLLSRKARSQSRWLTNALGESRLVSTHKVPMMGSRNEVQGVLGISDDITVKHQRERVDKHRNEILEKLAHGAPLDDILSDLVTFTEGLYPGLMGSILLLDERSGTLRLGMAPHLPDFYNAAVHGIAIGEGVGSCGAAAYSGRPVIVGNIARHPYWEPYTELAARAGLSACWSMPVKNRQGKVLGTFAIYHSEPSEPTTEQMELMMINAHLAAIAIESSQMDQQLSQLSQAVEHSASFVVICDQHQQIDYVNHSLLDASGYTCDGLKGELFTRLLAEDEDPALQHHILQTVQRGEVWHGERQLRRQNGEVFWVMSSVAPIRDHAGAVTHLVCVSEDITALKEDQERMARLAFYDPLTGLANRRLFKDRLDLALKQAQRQQQTLALLYLDLDRFKAVNDEYGHEVGDELLKEVARRLQATLRDSDVIARIGGDEFNIILPDIAGAEAAEQVADKVLQAVVEPFVTGSIELQVSASIGLTLFPDDGVDAKQLIKNADVAMYRSKAQGRNCRLRYSL